MAIVNPRQIWRGTTAERATITGASGLIGYDTTLKTFVAFDGVTLGGTVMQNAKLSLIPSDLTNSEKNTICRKINAIPVGAEMAWGSDTIPYGWLIEDGLTTYDVTANPELIPFYNWLVANGYTSLIIDATHFKTQDLRNLVIRGKGTLSGDFYTAQTDALPNIAGEFGSWSRDVMNWTYVATGAFGGRTAGSVSAVDNTGSESSIFMDIDASRSSAVYGRESTTEARVKSIARNFIIKW